MTDREIEKVISGLQRISLLAQLRDKVNEAWTTDRRECGSCTRWMKSSQCPRETNVNGRRRGPSMVAPACDKFEIEQWVVDLKAKRLAEAVAFARQHDLPVPPQIIA